MIFSISPKRAQCWLLFFVLWHQDLQVILKKILLGRNASFLTIPLQKGTNKNTFLKHCDVKPAYNNLLLILVPWMGTLIGKYQSFSTEFLFKLNRVKGRVMTGHRQTGPKSTITSDDSYQVTRGWSQGKKSWKVFFVLERELFFSCQFSPNVGQFKRTPGRLGKNLAATAIKEKSNPRNKILNLNRLKWRPEWNLSQSGPRTVL